MRFTRLAERFDQRVLELTNEKLALEQRVLEQETGTKRLEDDLAARPAQAAAYARPLDALIHTYLPSGAELAALLSMEYQLLSDNDDLGLIGRTLMTFAKYVEHKKGVAFLPEMLKTVAETAQWEELEEAKELLAKQKQRARALAGLKQAAESGMSEPVLFITRKAIEERYSLLDEEIARSHNAFVAAKSIAKEIPALEKQYDDLVAAIGNLEERTAATLPIVATEGAGAAHIYFPTIEGPLREAITQELKADVTEDRNGSTLFVINKPDKATERFLNNQERSRTASFLRGLGIVAKITRV